MAECAPARTHPSTKGATIEHHSSSLPAYDILQQDIAEVCAASGVALYLDPASGGVGEGVALHVVQAEDISWALPPALDVVIRLVPLSVDALQRGVQVIAGPD